MYYTYVLKSIDKKYRYVGMTDNLERRVAQHNLGYNKTTKPYLPFKLILSEEHPDRVTARTREKWLKSGVGREWLDTVVKSSL